MQLLGWFSAESTYSKMECQRMYSTHILIYAGRYKSTHVIFLYVRAWKLPSPKVPSAHTSVSILLFYFIGEIAPFEQIYFLFNVESKVN